MEYDDNPQDILHRILKPDYAPRDKLNGIFGF
jgi:hypothetical protein